MGIKNTKMEAELENGIISHLVNNESYLYIPPTSMKNRFNKKYAIDEVSLLKFIKDSQPNEYDILCLDTQSGKEKFFKRLDASIKQNGIVAVLKNGIRCYPSAGTILFYHALDHKRPESYKNFELNIFSITNQLAYSQKNQLLTLDLAILVNGLPIITVELKSKSSSTEWTFRDAEEQYKNDRDPKETIFNFKRCFAHFAVDENFITFTTKLEGRNTRFMPFNKGNERGGSGNPINVKGTMTDYLWEEILAKKTLTKLIRDFVYLSKENDGKEKLIFPRYQQYRVVCKLVNDVKQNGVGKRYLIQHSAGSGKSNSITWLSYLLVGVEYKEKLAFDSVVVVTDRINLDRQIEVNIRKFLDERSIVGHASSSKSLRDLLITGQKIIITTVQKFPYLLDKIGKELKSKKFAIIIDEAHSSQSGKAAASLNMAVSGITAASQDFDIEDRLNELIEARKMPENASFFAFTATPKAKTLEMFGSVFDLYSMKQAIEEGFILDVLKNYTNYDNYYRIQKIIADNPMFDKKRAQMKIRAYVEGQEFPIREKAEVMVNHFITKTANKIGGRAKAMIVTQNINRAIEYYYIVKALLKESGTGYEALIAFSGEKKYNGVIVSESSINGFSDSETASKFKENKFKFLIVADKYQTGYDEPLLHTMYVDKILNDVKAVQTLSRLNRCCKYKIDTCVIDFANSPINIMKSFQPYYKETKLETTTDPNKLYNILEELDSSYVYDDDDVEIIVENFLKNSSRYMIDPIIDKVVKQYKSLSINEQINFKSRVKSFIRTYNFIASILPIGQVEWEKKVIFFEHIVHRLPSPEGEDLSEGILETIDLESYRLEKNITMDIMLEDRDGSVKEADLGITRNHDVELAPVSDIVYTFNNIFGDIEWEDSDNVARQIVEIPKMLMKNKTFTNALKNSDLENIKREYHSALKQVFKAIMFDNMELFGQYTKNENFSNWLRDYVFKLVMKQYEKAGN